MAQTFTVYLAAPYPLRAEVQALARALEPYGIGCTSRWLWEPGAENDEWARKDIADIEAADVFVAINPPEWANKGTGGRHGEFGVAYHMEKPLLLVGVRTQILHHLSHVVVVPDISTLPSTLLAMMPAGVR